MPIKKYLRNAFKVRKKLFNAFPYRRYTNKHKCIFIHIPKTAGTSILKSLSGRRIHRDHATYFDYLRADSDKFAEYFKFTITRNPYDRIVSCYKYLHQGGNQKDDLYFKELFNTHFDTFERFVLDYLDKDRIHEHRLFKPQYLYIFDHKEQCQVDYVGRFEDLDTAFSFISQKLNLSSDLLHTNKSKRSSFQDYYTNPKVKEKITYLYKKDLSLLNYSFNIS